MKLKELASKLGLKLRGDGEIEILAPVPIEAAGPGTIIFAAGAKYTAALRTTTAAAAIVPADLIAEAKCATLESQNPVFDFSRVLGLFFPPYRPPAGIHPTAIVAPGAVASDDVSIGAYCVIGSGVKIGKRAAIHPHVTIYPNVTIGDDFTCHSHVSIREGVTIGNRVTLLNGAVIGADGFGIAREGEGWVKIPQIGRVVIGDDVEIGANTTIDRGALDDTVLEDGVKLDNQIQIGHNVRVGAHTAMAGCVAVAGSADIGRRCTLGAAAVILGHLSIADDVHVSAGTVISRSIHKAGTYTGMFPFDENASWARNTALVRHLAELADRLRALERKGKNNG